MNTPVEISVNEEKDAASSFSEPLRTSTSASSTLNLWVKPL